MSSGEPGLSLQRLLPCLVAVAFFMDALDAMVVSTAIPAIAASMDVAPVKAKSVLASYTLSLALFTPISSWLADRYGTRTVFLGAVATFTLGSILCGLATSIGMLTLCRVLQGMGGAMMLPVGRMTLVRFLDQPKLIAALGLVGIFDLTGEMTGPLIGGFITEYLDWRAVFYVNVPFGVLGLYFVKRYLPDFRETTSYPFDLVGFLLFGGGIALLSYVLEIFGEHHHNWMEVSFMVTVSMAMLAGYCIRGKRMPHAFLDLGLFQVRTFRVAVGGGFLVRLGINGIPFLLPLLYQVGLGFTPTVSGLLLLPQAISAIALNAFVPAMVERIGYRKALIGNTVLLSFLVMSFGTIDADTPIWVIVGQSFLFGLVSSVQYTSMNALIFCDVPAIQASAGSAISTTGQQLATSLGVAVAGLAVALFVPPGLHSHAAAILYGLQHAFLVVGIVTLLSSAIFFGLRDTDGEDISKSNDTPA